MGYNTMQQKPDFSALANVAPLKSTWRSTVLGTTFHVENYMPANRRGNPAVIFSNGKRGEEQVLELKQIPTRMELISRALPEADDCVDEDEDN